MKLSRLLRRFAGRARRPLTEALADANHEIRVAPTALSRVARFLGAVAALSRVLAGTGLAFEEPPFRHAARDVARAARRLRATPAFSFFAVVSIALGIGATTASSSIVRIVLGPPPGVTTLDRLTTINHHPIGPGPLSRLTYGDYLDLRARQDVFQDVAGWAHFRASYVAKELGRVGWAEVVSGEYFQVLGVQPALGRLLQPADDSPSAPRAAVIGYDVWRQHFGGSPDAVGQHVRVNGVDFEIVGVASPEFGGLFNGGHARCAAWIPMAAAATVEMAGYGVVLDPDDRSRHWVNVRARLAPGRTLEQARAQVATIAAQLDQEHPRFADLPPGASTAHTASRPWTVRLSSDISFNEAADRLVRRLSATLMVAVGLVLLMACTNVATLLLVRGGNRRHELAVRVALGASRWRLLREAASEIFLVAGLAGLAALGLARVLHVLLGNIVSSSTVSFIGEPQLDAVALAVSAGITLVALLVAGLAPAFQAMRVDARPALTTEESYATAPRFRVRRFLVAGQVAMSLLLVSVAAMFFSQLRAAGRHDTGFDVDRIAVARVDFARQRYEPPRARQIVDAVLAQLAGRPGVESVAAGSGLPFGSPGALGRLGIDTPRRTAVLIAATPGIFDVLGIPIVRGRGISPDDHEASHPVAVVDERTAVALFERADVVGQQVVVQRRRPAGATTDHPLVHRTIVGVTAGRDGLEPDFRAPGVIYIPLDQHYEGSLLLIARAAGKPADLVGPLRRAIGAVAPEAAIDQADVGPVIAGLSEGYLVAVSGISSALGSFVLLLALVGLVGVLSNVVAQMRREIGIRMALGATRGRVHTMVIRDGLRVVSGGIGFGLALALLAHTWARPLFQGEGSLPPLEVSTLAAVSLAMVAAGVLASSLPARRASAIDPSIALRNP